MNILLYGYIFFALFTLQNCKPNNDVSTAEQLLQKKQETAKLLMQEFDAKMFECNAKSILNKTAILDTLLLGMSHQGSENYLKAELITACGEKYFAKLKCSKEIVKRYYESKSNHAYLAAKISGIDNVNLFANVDSLDGRHIELALGNSVILSGECVSINEIAQLLN